MDETFKEKIQFLTRKLRLVFVLGIYSVMFYLLCAKLFELQILNGTEYTPTTSSVSILQTSIAPQRGEIYDRFGRPLAINEIVYTVNIDPTAKVDNPNEVFYNFVKLMEANDEEIINDFKITQTEPREFLFNGSETRKNNWLRDMGVTEENRTPDLAYEQLLSDFGIPEEWSDHEKYMVLSLRSAVFMQRYNREHFQVSRNVKKETIVVLEERNQEFGGIYVDLNYLRVYPEGKYVSHLIGYIGRISESEYEANKALGYSATDLIGKDGIEKAFEFNLRGVEGTRVVQLASNGRRVAIDESREPTQGDKVFLTLDVELTKKAFHILEDKLTEILVNKLKGLSDREGDIITPKQLIASMTDANNISIKKIMESETGSLSYPVKAYIVLNSDLNSKDSDYDKKLKDYILEQIEENEITVNQMILVMIDQGIITATDTQLEQLLEKRLSIIPFLVEKLEQKEITPQMTSLEPSTGSVVVQSVHTGEILAYVSYPTYDNNEFVNGLNAEYYNALLSDPTTPLINRAFVEKRAPGSTFKMITAIAALETNAITVTDRIYDAVVFEKAGLGLRCWSGGSHGNLTVCEALEVSCNYFFSEASFRMGNIKETGTTQAIDKLNEYMIKFGLNDLSGVEIYEPFGYETILNISSPSLKRYIENSSWADGDTIRTSIGQSLNQYTSAVMAKYIATLAAEGKRYQSHFLNRIESADGELLSEFEPVLELELELRDESLKAVYDGMLQVTGVLRGTDRGTARRAFENFPIDVAGKTGTAEQLNGASHLSFGGFAPFDDPQISIYVMIPRGDTQTTSAPAAHVARDVIAAYFGLDSEPERQAEGNSLAR